MRTTRLKCIVILFGTLLYVGAAARAQTPGLYHQPCASADASVSSRHCGAPSLGSRSPGRVQAPPPAPPVASARPARPVAREASVSLARLRHAPPPAAVREVERAQESFARGKTEVGLRRLEKAIEIHPDFIEARNNLGVHYMRADRVAEAVEQFERVLELDPSAAQTWTNLSFALFAQQRLEDARFAASRALEIDSRSAAAHLSLGRILLAQGTSAASAVEHLSSAGERFPRARLLAAEALLASGEAGEARKQLRLFLALQAEPIR